MLTHLIAVTLLALSCAAWVLLQRWIAANHPEVRGPEDGAGCGSGRCASSGRVCDKQGRSCGREPLPRKAVRHALRDS